MINYQIVFNIIVVLYFIHRMHLLPYCPFCKLHESIVRWSLKICLKAYGKNITYEKVVTILKESPTSLWIKIFDELTCTTTNYEEETETEQISPEEEKEFFQRNKEFNQSKDEEETLP